MLIFMEERICHISLLLLGNLYIGNILDQIKGGYINLTHQIEQMQL